MILMMAYDKIKTHKSEEILSPFLSLLIGLDEEQYK